MKATEFFKPEQVKLLEAIQKGNETRARQMLEDGDVALNTRGKDDITPLFWLMMQKNHQAVERALRLGADPNQMAGNGHSPVTFIAGGNDTDMLRLLLEHDGDPNSKDADGEPALFSAIGHDRWENIKLLLKYGAKPDLTDNSNNTSLQYAAYLNKYEIVHYLIQQGSDYRERNDAGSNISWVIHDRLSNDLINPESSAYEWAQKVKKQLQERGVEFPPPSPEEIREQRGKNQGK
ncbi:ankyrin repeat domain-containing protein [Halovibrio salipaludis]|nr:ankyrin repeat domain-containing protein [Halovibrio salipaludis]